MTAYNFKSVFAEMVESNNKFQTIRRVRKGHNPIPGEILQLYQGMRTKACKKIKDVHCISVDKIWIEYERININGKELNLDERNDLAYADGFHHNPKTLYEFFLKTYGFPFEGILIRWENL